jgi:serine/threonine protein kinase/tetratricopeptide (TPR) repeat protein
MSVDFGRMQEVFLAAVERHAPDQWDAYLVEACAGDEELRAQVGMLLKAHAQEGSLPGRAALGLDRTGDFQPLTECPGTVIGPYRLMEQIGEGGMGLVFVAEQQHPVRRKVALKVIKPGMDSRAVIARFEAERQALALMDHPNIARVLDGGETSSGRPYFVMELVKGVPITEFCDQNRVSIRERLELFVPVCEAVLHAHQKGIIHRDIKPSNVLVVSHDGKPVVKVIDFGVAKAIGQRLTDKTVYTHFAQLIGTPLYMSPEQAGESGLDVDTRSDIYSLGVLLYELLTGTTPFDPERLRTAGQDEMRRIIREEEPPRPSTRISTLGQAAATVSTRRKSDPRQLSRLFRGELDWVVMKCLEKDRNRRYETASALAADVERYLADEPVQARPAAVWYRLRKLARRNRAVLVPAALVLTLVGVGIGAAAWSQHERSARRTETERGVKAALVQAATLLEEADKQREQPERWRATARLAQEAVERARGLLAASEGTSELAAEVNRVGSAAATAAADSGLLVEVERIRLEMAEVKDGRFDSARAAPRYAELLRGYGVDPADPQEAAARVRGSRVRTALVAALEEWWWATTDAAEERRLDEVLQAIDPPATAFREQWRAAAERHDGPMLVRLAQELAPADLPPSDLVRLAHSLGHANEWAAAERLLRAGQERFPGDFWLNHNLGMALKNLGPARAEEAVRYLTAALALRSDSPGVFLNLGNALKGKGDLEGAMRCYQAALRIDPAYAMAHNGLGLALLAGGDVSGAIEEYRKAIAFDPNFAKAHFNLGDALKDKKDLDGAIREYRLALELEPGYIAAHNNLGFVLQKKGDLDGAIREYRLALGLDPTLGPALLNLGSALQARGDVEGAIREFRRALEHHPEFVQAHNNLGSALKARGDVEGAIREYRLALDLDPKHAGTHYNLGKTLKVKGDTEGAIREYRLALELDGKLARAHYDLGNALLARGDLDGAIREYRLALDSDPEDAYAHHGLGFALHKKGDVEEAIPCYQAAIRIDPGFASAHCNLGQALRIQGRYAESLNALKTGHELGSRQANWRYQSEAWVREAERLVALDQKLTQVLKGEAQPADAAEEVALAWLCQRPPRQLPAAGVRLYAAAFADGPRLADDMKAQHRYGAASAAALAGCGRGKDDPPPGAGTQEKLRRQALDWLRADLDAYARLLAGTDRQAPALVRQRLEHWQKDAEFRGVRGEESLARLPEAERQSWRQLWDDVARTLARAQAATVPEKKSDMK